MTARTLPRCVEFASTCQAELIEHRLDFMQIIDELEKIYDASEVPFIATCRPITTGGYFMGREEERVEHLLNAIDAGASYVDLEVETERCFVDIVRDAIEPTHCQLILSKHYYDLTPKSADLARMHEYLLSEDSSMSKIVTTPTTMNDCFRTLRLYDLQQPGAKPLIAFSMGALGRITRVCSLFHGAPFAYVSMDLGEEAAPGQIRLSTMRAIMEELY
jgi:3-dehydroquinate dehydratase type I